VNLLVETGRSTTWVGRITRRFLSVCALRTIALIATITGKRFALLLAFFLPLKVILLAGSDGVPRYFRFFIDPADKTPWIIWLSVGAVVFYLLSLLFEQIAARLAERGSNLIITQASQASLSSQQLEEMQGNYRKFCRISADSLVALIGLVLIYWLDPLLFSTTVAGISLAYLIPWVVIGRGDLLNPSRSVRFITEKTDAYLQICLAVIFLAGFFAILSRFIVDDSGNILIAIISILLLRQILSGLSNNATLITSLWTSRFQIDPVVFPDNKLVKEEHKLTRKFRSLFSQEQRRSDLVEALDESGLHSEDLNLCYVDCALPKFYLFEATTSGKVIQGSTRLQVQVFSKRSLSGLEHEEFLFGHVSRRDLRAPRVVCRYPVGVFECQVVDWPVDGNEEEMDWKSLLVKLMSFYWAIAPKKSLVRAYRSSNMLLHERLSEELFERVTVAVDSDKEQVAFERFLEHREKVVDTLEAMPLCIRNPDLSPAFVAQCGDGEWRAMIWQRWKIDQVGVGLPASLADEELQSILDTLCKSRKLASTSLTKDHLQLASDCDEMEKSISRDAYNRAIELMRRITENPVIGVS
jgi:hypothetical protein